VRAPARLKLAKHEGNLKEIAPGVTFMTAAIVNLHTIDVPQRNSWVLVDTGLRISSGAILKAVAQRYGTHSRPSCIVLTHGHFDHAGSVEQLAELWDVPVYAHRLEKPYLTGESSYPPFDPTVGGLMSQMARFFPRTPYDVSDRFREVDEEMDELPGWQILHTPGHTHGHVSLFREQDGVLLAGDAFSTVDQQSFAKTLVQYREFASPPAYATTDWVAALDSIEHLATLGATVVATGHGQPISGRTAAARLEKFARDFKPPKDGRYVREPARADETGITHVPPPVADPLPKIAAGVAIASAAVAAGYFMKRRKAA
jgi:glyoxylase-like metal-dependent hydrolase (beta-lactamase superfamily II)